MGCYGFHPSSSVLPGFDLADPELQDIAVFQWDGLRGQLAHTELGTLQVTQTLHLCELGA